MARKPRSRAAARPAAGGAKPEFGSKTSGPKAERERIIESFMDLLAETDRENRLRRDRNCRRRVAFPIARDIRIDARHSRGPYQGDRPARARRRRRRDRGGIAARTTIRCADASNRAAGAAQGCGSLVAALMQAGSGPGVRPQWACRSLTAMDADRGRHRCGRTARHGARAGTGAPFRVGAAHLGERRRSWSRPHHGGARPRAGARTAAGPVFSTTFAGFPNASAGCGAAGAGTKTTSKRKRWRYRADLRPAKTT